MFSNTIHKGAKSIAGRLLKRQPNVSRASSLHISGLSVLSNTANCSRALQLQHQCFHTTTVCQEAAAATTVTSNNKDQSAKSSEDQTKTKKEDKNIFLDNLGTIFLSVIGVTIAYLVRSFYGSTMRNRLRDELEDQATLDPLEIDELRQVNPGLRVSVFRSLIREVRNRFPDGQSTYQEFSETIRELLVKEHQIPTIEFGHLLDRIVLSVLNKKGISSTEPQPITLWFTVLSLAQHSPTPDRIRVLYDILQDEARSQVSELSASMDSDGSSSPTVTLHQVQQLVGYLQDTDQLVIETQLIPTPKEAYPIQKYHRGSPQELVHWEGSESDAIDVDALASILRSRSVCAWGECYSRKKFT